MMVAGKDLVVVVVAGCCAFLGIFLVAACFLFLTAVVGTIVLQAAFFRGSLAANVELMLSVRA